MGCGCCKSPCRTCRGEESSKSPCRICRGEESSKSPPPNSRGEERSKSVVPLANPISPSLSPPSSPILPKRTPPKSKPRQLPEKVLEDFIVVWLNPSADDDPTTQDTEEQLQELVSVVVTFTDPDECYAFINHIEHEKIFLVVSGTTVEHFAPRIQEVSQIDSIYCLDSKEEVSNTQNDNIPRLAGTFSSPSLLCKELKADIKICGHNLVKPVVIQSEPERLLFMYDQLFREIILKSEEENLEEFYHFCETYHSSNRKEQGEEHLITLRKEYSKEKAISWYTEESPLYKVAKRSSPQA